MSRARTALLIGLLLATAPTQAQIVNVLPLARSLPAGWSGSAQLSLDLRSGNTALTQFQSRGQLAHLSKSGLLLGVLRSELRAQGRRTQRRFANATFIHIRYRHTLALPWQWEWFAQYEFDEFRRLALRALVGSGPRFQQEMGRGSFVALGVAVMGEYERLRTGAEPDAGAVAQGVRLSSYLSVELPLSQRALMKETVFIQPRWGNWDDFRLLSELTLSAALSQRITLPVGLVLRHDSRPPSGVEPTDVAFQTAIQFRL
ncbi:MAG: hypothetical protein KatS3mg115_0431 [Candidatus Poribacteria bacterium]|nr:MAG: hypothetical protein KatS3mg115_0431 [Candidatus Poribacteria bacterium]